VRAEIDCATSPVRYLCPVARLSQAVEFDPPEHRVALMGITVALRNSRTIHDSSMETAHGSVLVIEGQQVGIRALRPTNSAEREELSSVIGDVSRIIKGEGDTVWVSKPFDDFMTDPPDLKLAPYVTDTHGASFDNGKLSRLYRIEGFPYGASWVSFETTDSATFLSIYPDVPRKIQ